ncbi:MAG TPA: hypothetical protein VNU49_09040 [Opitutaceae bacterium]|jgi:hypothetical protein|nr:hypothetical protein [Opitutaceae bacterium]
MARGARKYPIPEHIKAQGVLQKDFGGWLDRVSAAHIRRDRKRTGVRIQAAVYREAIYRAVCDGGDHDFYTGEPLDWKLLRFISKSDGVGRDERQIPTVDHEGLSTDAPVFRISSMRTNKCKSNYSVEHILEFCEAFVGYQRRVRPIL